MQKEQLDDIISERAALEKAGKMHFIHWMVIFLSLALTFFAWSFAKSQVDEKISKQFDREVEHVVELVTERMQKYEDALWSGVANIQSNDKKINFLDWKKFSHSLKIHDRYPGISGIGVIYNIKPDELPDYLKRERKLRPNYKIHPKHGRDEYWPITYIEPVSKNAAAVGLDMAHEKHRYEAIVKARDTGTTQITGPITLVQDSAKTPGFLFYFPFYKNGLADSRGDINKEFLGVVYAPFIVKNLMGGTLEKEKRYVGISINDGQSNLYNEHSSEFLDYDPKPMFTEKVDVNLYGRTWGFDVRSTKSFRAKSHNNQPIIILGAGLTIDFLLLILFISLSRSNKNALEFANRMSQEYQNKSADLEEAIIGIEKANVDLELSNQELERFAHIVSHDLQEPLRTINGFCDRFAKKYEDELDDQANVYINFITSGVIRMQDLIKGLLAYSTVLSGDIVKEEINTEEALQIVIHNLKDAIDREKATVTYDDLPAIRFNEPAFQPIFQNLILNGIRYRSSKNPIVNISAREEEDFWVFSVKDNGMGIEEKFYRRVFEMFQRLHRTEDIAGTGMGLPLCKKIIERHGGDIWLESKIGEGTTFHFSIPK